jgi:Zn-dependent peptidase ImmA (M78 family)
MTTTITTNPNPGYSLLANLRAVVPGRPMLFSEALRVAELQANRLLELTDIHDGAVPNEIIGDLPRVRIEYRELPTSGMSFWNGQAWVICLNSAEPRTRQRFTLFHEFKHILDHGRTANLYRGNSRASAEAQAEQAADYFAGCALMPKRLIKRAWGNGVQRPSVLGALFEVSARAVDVRLSQLGLTEPRVRCAPMSKLRYRQPAPGTYLRQLSERTPIRLAEGAAA